MNDNTRAIDNLCRLIRSYKGMNTSMETTALIVALSLCVEELLQHDMMKHHTTNWAKIADCLMIKSMEERIPGVEGRIK